MSNHQPTKVPSDSTISRRSLIRSAGSVAAGAAMLGSLSNVHLLDPQPYLPFVFLMEVCYLILTDSGGVQEEAPSLGKPVLVMRDRTERPEAVKAGTVRLVGTSSHRIVSEIERLLTNRKAYHTMSRRHNPYGDGKSSGRIVRALRTYLRGFPT